MCLFQMLVTITVLISWSRSFCSAFICALVQLMVNGDSFSDVVKMLTNVFCPSRETKVSYIKAGPSLLL